MTQTPTQFIAAFKTRWEGGMSKDPNDAGNWSTGTKGSGKLIGSNHGITSRVLAAYRGVRVDTLSMADMEKLTADEAGKIALKLFYQEPGFDKLPWNHVTASIMDLGYNAGPKRAAMMLQNMLDLPQDGAIGPNTIKAYTNFITVKGEAFAAGAWWALRETFYEDLVANRPTNGIYLKGWDNRSDYYTPGHKEGWWSKFG